MNKKTTKPFWSISKGSNIILLLCCVFFLGFTPKLIAQPSIAITSTPVYSGSVAPGTSSVILQKFNFAVTLAPATFTGLTVSTLGNYGSSDITNIKVRYSTDATLDAGDATLSTFTTPGVAGSKVFPSFVRTTISSGSTATIFVTADVSGGATLGKSISISTISFSNISFVSGTKTGVNPLPAGGTKVFCASVAAAPVVTGTTSLSCSGSTTLTSSVGASTGWYDSPSGGTLLGVGTNFSTPTLNTSTVYYAQNGIPSITTQTITYTGSLQTFTVPAGVYFINITAKGGQGGNQTNDAVSGGLGAIMTGTFAVTPGQVLNVLVGGQGVAATYVGGGGGGTFVWDNATGNLLNAAGGGGGAGKSDAPSSGLPGLDASIGLNGVNGGTMSAGAGSAGSGGIIPPGYANYASGGAGWFTNGNNGTIHGCSSNSTGGTRPLAGGAGGIGGGSIGTPNGGYGGGGGGNGRCGAVGGGGGGGYSGGGAGGEVTSGLVYPAGGGGGSFNAGTSQSNSVGNTGDGAVIITYYPTIITSTLSYTGSLQTFTVPADVSSLTITTKGGQGGNQTFDAVNGGQGAIMTGTFAVTPGQVLNVLVGGQGVAATFVGGGGGGSFVWDNASSTLLSAAGGGGGAGKSDSPSSGLPGLDASTGLNGVNGGTMSGGAGTAGNGGIIPPGYANYASGGAGWLSNGNNGTIHGCASNSTGGTRPLAGGAGGIGGGSAGTPNGGYGGGGGGNGRCGAVGGGGGGGYSGGGAGGEVTSGSVYPAGGGGGSFNGGTSQANSIGNTGDGQVIITYNVPNCSSDRTAVTIDITGSPVASADTTIKTCQAASLRATPNSVSDIIEWYDAPTGGTLVHTGANFTTPALNINKSYYVQNITPASTITSTFNYTGAMTNYTVPAGVSSVTIEAQGGQGLSATGGAFIGGLGARMRGNFSVNPGDQMIVLVGGAGVEISGNGGGGGGSFVVKVDPASSDNIASGPFTGSYVTPLVIAGGGGGTRASASQNGNPGVITTTATTASGSSSTGGGAVSGTIVGNGGIASATSWGSAGAGFRTNGADDISWGFGGISFLNGGAGGVGSCGSGSGASGGFGGGGSGGGCNGGGGGGGYTGGDGGFIAGGGGSFNSGTSQSNSSGVRSGNGIITISYVVPACTTSREVVNVTVLQIALPTVTNGIRCGTGSVTLTATPTLAGETIDWYADSIGGSVLAGGTGTNTFNTPSISTTTVYYAQVRNISTGCVSSTRIRVIATISTTSATSSTQTTCSNQPILFNGVLRNSSGAYLDTFTNVGGCDSIVTLNLTVIPTSAGSFTQTICGGSSYLFNGVNLTASGPYLDTLPNAGGCDSVVTLNLFVTALSSGTINQTVCNGSSYLFNGVNLTTTGAYKDTLTNVLSCDSIVTLNLTVRAASTGTITTTIATGSSYLFNGVNLTTAGVYKDTLSNIFGCDSVVTLNLSVGTSIATVADLKWEMSIYPNPALRDATVSYTLPIEVSTLEVLLYDIQGKIMMSDYINHPKIKGNYALSLHNLADGVYFVKLVADGYSETRRVVVDKD